MLGVLLLAHGGPGSLEEVPEFPERVRGGRPNPDSLLDEVRYRYRRIGGASPLPDITRRSAAKLQEVCGLRVHVGMRHCHPFLEEAVPRAVPRMVADEISRALVICLVPHFSDRGAGERRRRAAAVARTALLNDGRALISSLSLLVERWRI